MPQAGALIQLFFHGFLSVLQKLSFCAAICGILAPERIAFASPFAAFCAVMPAAVVWRCRLAALPAVSVAAFSC